MAEGPTIRVPPGIMRGESRAHIPQRWYDANLVRWKQGLLSPVGGWERLNPTPFASVPRAGHVWLDTESNRHMAVLCDAHVYREREGVYTNITPTGFVDANSTAARGYGSGMYGQKDYGRDDEARASGISGVLQEYVKFSADNWNDELLFSSSADGRLFVWSPQTPGTAPAVVPNAPLFIQAFLVTDEHHVMTFGAQGFPNRVSWSDAGNRNSWDPTVITGQAGFFDLENAGSIITAYKIPSGILVFTSTGVWLGRYLGAPYYYGFNRISEGAVPISAHAVAVAGSKAYWIGKRSFWKYEGGVVAPVTSTLGLEPFESFAKASNRRVCAGFNGAYPEVWFFYPSEQELSITATENNRYIIYSFDPGNEWWADGYIGRSMFFSSPVDGFPIAGDSYKYIYQHEKGYLAEGSSRAGMCFAEIGSISFNDGASCWQVNQFQIDSALGAESVTVDIWGRRARGGPEEHLQTCTPRPNGYVDAHFTARDFSMRIIGQVDGPWSLGAMVFNNIAQRGQG
jgi:hypothetical protein